MKKPLLVLDFDGVCHSYTSGWHGITTIPDTPVAGLWDFLLQACRVFEVHIYSSRSHQEGGIAAMINWFGRWAPYRGPCRASESSITWEFESGVSLSFPSAKPPAFLTLDDRALTFTGTWPDPSDLLTFKPWHKA